MATKQPASDGLARTNNTIRELRGLVPVRPLRFHEHLVLAERQTTRLLQLLDQRSPAVELSWLTEFPGITVVLQPRWKMDGLSGLTTWHDGRWIIGVNKGNSHTRRRFTLGHELKHVLDATRDKITYRDIDANQREQIANYFAACLLMPKAWVRKAWTSGIQDPEALAGLFKVSTEAMATRLEYLGFIERDAGRSIASYFRTELAA